jgi:hypothetical protein
MVVPEENAPISADCAANGKYNARTAKNISKAVDFCIE